VRSNDASGSSYCRASSILPVHTRQLSAVLRRKSKRRQRMRSAPKVLGGRHEIGSFQSSLRNSSYMLHLPLASKISRRTSVVRATSSVFSDPQSSSPKSRIAENLRLYAKEITGFSVLSKFYMSGYAWHRANRSRTNVWLTRPSSNTGLFPPGRSPRARKRCPACHLVETGFTSSYQAAR